MTSPLVKFVNHHLYDCNIWKLINSYLEDDKLEFVDFELASFVRMPIDNLELVLDKIFDNLNSFRYFKNNNMEVNTDKVNWNIKTLIFLVKNYRNYLLKSCIINITRHLDNYSIYQFIEKYNIVTNYYTKIFVILSEFDKNEVLDLFYFIGDNPLYDNSIFLMCLSCSINKHYNKLRGLLEKYDLFNWSSVQNTIKSHKSAFTGNIYKRNTVSLNKLENIAYITNLEIVKWLHSKYQGKFLISERKFETIHFDLFIRKYENYVGRIRGEYSFDKIVFGKEVKVFYFNPAIQDYFNDIYTTNVSLNLYRLHETSTFVYYHVEDIELIEFLVSKRVILPMTNYILLNPYYIWVFEHRLAKTRNVLKYLKFLRHFGGPDIFKVVCFSGAFKHKHIKMDVVNSLLTNIYETCNLKDMREINKYLIDVLNVFEHPR
jgi:hypothetical protein